MKVLSCRDAGVDCDFEVRAETVEEIYELAAEHGRTAHNMQEISDELKAKMYSLIRDE
jgi:predicted small metal-binding protein